MPDKIIAAAIDSSGELTGIGRAPRMAIVSIHSGSINKIEEIDVKWDEAHEKEQEGLHHSKIAKFLKAHNVTDIVAFGAGPDMRRMIERLGIVLHLASGDYREAIKKVVEESKA